MRPLSNVFRSSSRILSNVPKRRAAEAALAALLVLAPACNRKSSVVGSSSSSSPTAAAVKARPLPEPAPGQASIPAVVAKVLPSVVNISMTRVEKFRTGGVPFFNDPFFRHFFGGGGRPAQREEHGLGSGVIVSKDGVILTNNHVVEKATEIQVTTTDKRQFQAKVVGTDPKTDLAVIRIEKKVDDLKPIEIGQSSRLRLGDTVLAIGDPFGVGQTVTMGIVSAKGRANLGIEDYEDFIQTDAAINPGNSGGALVSLDGKLVGINTAILSRSGGSSGIGFAIPTDMAKPIMESLLKYGKVRRGWLGVAIQNVDPDLAQALNLPKAEGVLISDVVHPGPAAKAGLKRGDVVLKFNGKPVNSTNELRNQVALAGPGVKAKLDLLRNGKALTIQVQLGEMPSHGENPSASNDQGSSAAPSKLVGLTLQTLDAAARAQLHLPSSLQGVLVTAVKSDSKAQRAGLRAGDVIIEVDHQAVKSSDDFMRAWRASGNTALLLVYRGGNTAFIVVHK